MTSETKVPMPKPLGHVHSDGTWSHERNEAELWPIPVHTRYDVLTYGDQRASERDAFWMAKVAELEKDAELWKRWLPWMRGINRKPFDLAMEILRIDQATLTNPRAGEIA